MKIEWGGQWDSGLILLSSTSALPPQTEWPLTSPMWSSWEGIINGLHLLTLPYSPAASDPFFVSRVSPLLYNIHVCVHDILLAACFLVGNFQQALHGGSYPPHMNGRLVFSSILESGSLCTISESSGHGAAHAQPIASLWSPSPPFLGLPPWSPKWGVLVVSLLSVQACILDGSLPSVS